MVLLERRNGRKLGVSGDIPYCMYTSFGMVLLGCKSWGHEHAKGVVHILEMIPPL